MGGMAVTVMARPVTPGAFARLKLRMTANALRGQTWRMLFFVIGTGLGVGLAVLGFLGFAAGASDAGPFANPVKREALVVFLGAALVLGWIIAPLLYFGVDETLDPARFGLLPVSRRTLALGMLIAAFTGIPAAATLVASAGLVFFGAVRAGPGGALVGLLGGAAGLLLCVVASRAVTSAFAGALRSRRTRDVAAIAIAVIASALGPAQLILASMFQNSQFDQVLRLARVVAWTPLGAPYAAVVDATAGRWGLVAVRLAIVAATTALLLVWWSRTLETAMLGTVSSGVSDSGPTAGPAGVVAVLFPGALRALPRSRFGAIVSREARYLWRDPRRRAGLVSLAMAGIVVPVALRVVLEGSRTPLPYAVVIGGMLAGMALANQFGHDGVAYAAHVLAGVPGRVELRARVAGLAVVMVPGLAAVTTVVALLTEGLAELPAALGAVFAGFAASSAVASVVSVRAAYSLPDSTNPLAMSGGSAGARSLVAMAGMVVASALTAPVLATFTRLDAAWTPLVLPLGIVWGVLVLWVGTSFAGTRLDQRGPDVLQSITPRR